MAAARASNVWRTLQHVIFRFEARLEYFFRNQQPPLGPALAVADIEPAFNQNNLPEVDDDTSLWDGLLWAVPKRRRSKEKNKTRRRASNKMIKRVQYLGTCDTCGHPKKLNFLCGNCLTRIREETKVVQEQLLAQLDEQKDGKADRETSVLYQGEEPRLEDNSKDIVEVKKTRPHWFSRDLTFGKRF